ncbi:hypothetical protein [Vibrio mediterranei]|uniref:hypothetical protein n=1 Tax=Vibrio mediterranei TaxID=689 RepID=UPI001EFCBE30|nr:hypothetical protein [Vibrio mediterranei]MCG9657618.1 hypothetical protein [Vibrio mediterranei]
MIEEQKLSLQAGEFIHTLSNGLVDGTIQIDGVTSIRAKLIMELSESLRRPNTHDRYAPLLFSEGFHISQYPRSAWIDLACRLLDEPEETPLVDIFSKLPTVRDKDELLEEFDSREFNCFSEKNSVNKVIVITLFLMLLLFLLFGSLMCGFLYELTF